MWAELLPSLAAAGYRAIAVDLPGHGDAEPGRAPHSAVLETMDALEVERAALIGNSYGGAVAPRVGAGAPGRGAAPAVGSSPPPRGGPAAGLEAPGGAGGAPPGRG